MSDAFLIGRRLSLRLFEEAADGAETLRWWNHPLCRLHLPAVARPATSLAEVPSLAPASALRLSVVLSEGNLPVGLVCLQDLDPFQRRAELFVLVQPEWQRRRIASEACELLVGHAFERLGLDLLSARLDEGHEAGRRLATRLGFEQVAVLPQWNLHGGRRSAELILALTRDRLDQLRAGKPNPWSN